MKSNTIVTASDQNYAWGVWLLIASIRKNGMDEPVLIGAHRWQKQWLEDIVKFPDVRVCELEVTDKRCVACYKPDIMLKAETDFSTWIDCDGIFTGNCSDLLYGEKDRLYIRGRMPDEVKELYTKERLPGDHPEEVPARILDVWQKDVGDRAEPVRKRGCSTAVLSIHRSRFDFLETWRTQMLKVLPDGVGIVDDGSFAYFQTDEAVMNSLLLYDSGAPAFTERYRLDHPDQPHYLHFAFNPKPWQMWNPYALRHYEMLLDLVEWGIAAGYAPQAKVPYTFLRKNKSFCRMLAPMARNVNRFKKLKRKLLG